MAESFPSPDKMPLVKRLERRIVALELELSEANQEIGVLNMELKQANNGPRTES
jgi:hypothetical protein